MKVNYHLADFVSKMNLAVKGRYSRVIVFRTKFILNLIKVLQRNGFIERFVLHERYISIYLKFFKSRCVFSYIELISRPGKRQYWNLEKLNLKKSSTNFSGFYIVSTPKGLLTNDECLLVLRHSGEVLFRIVI